MILSPNFSFLTCIYTMLSHQQIKVLENKTTNNNSLDHALFYICKSHIDKRFTLKVGNGDGVTKFGFLSAGSLPLLFTMDDDTPRPGTLFYIKIYIRV